MFSLWVGYEVFAHLGQFRSMAPGWKFVSILGMAVGVKNCIQGINNYYYAPVMAAYLRKY